MSFTPNSSVGRRVLALVFPDAEASKALRLEPLAEALLVFGARVAVSPLRPTVWLDISGCAHLHASCTDASGEPTLAESVCDLLGDAGIAFRVAIADGPFLAEGVARGMRYARNVRVHVVPPGNGAEALAPLPLSALFLEPELHVWLQSVGVFRVGQLAALPRATLGPRLGKCAAQVLGLVRGHDAAPLFAYEPPDFPEESMSFEEGAASLEPLVFAAKTLADALSLQLDARAMAASGLRCRLHFDKAMAGADHSAILDFKLVTPLYRANDILGIVRAKFQAYTLAAPVMRISLRAQPLVLRPKKALHLFVAESKAEQVLPQLVAEIEAELGESCVGTLLVEDAWLPEARSSLQRMGARECVMSASFVPADAPVGQRVSGAAVPTRLLVAPRSLTRTERAAMCAIEGQSVERLEAVMWWKGASPQRDFRMLWCPERAMSAWVEDDTESGASWLRGWFD